MQKHRVVDSAFVCNSQMKLLQQISFYFYLPIILNIRSKLLHRAKGSNLDLLRGLELFYKIANELTWTTKDWNDLVTRWYS